MASNREMRIQLEKRGINAENLKKWQLYRGEELIQQRKQDVRLEQAGLLDYQTQGLSQQEIASRYQKAGIRVNEDWFQQHYSGGGIPQPQQQTQVQSVSQPLVNKNAETDYHSPNFDWTKLSLSQKRDVLNDPNFKIADVSGMGQQGLVASDPMFNLWGKSAKGELQWWQAPLYTALSNPKTTPLVQGAAMTLLTQGKALPIAIPMTALAYGAQSDNKAIRVTSEALLKPFMWGAQTVEQIGGVWKYITDSEKKTAAFNRYQELTSGKNLIELAQAGDDPEIVAASKAAYASPLFNMERLSKLITDPNLRTAVWEASKLSYETGVRKGSIVTQDLNFIPESQREDTARAVNAVIPLMREANTAWVIGENEPVPVQPNYTLDDAVKRIMEGEPSSQVLEDFRRVYGVTGVASDFLSQSIYDPLNIAPHVVSGLKVKGLEHINEGIRAAGELTPEQSTRIQINDIKADVFRDTQNMTGLALPWSEAGRKFKELIQARITPEQAKYLTPWERTVAGLTPDGRIRELLPKGEQFSEWVPQWIQSAITLQPKAKAKLFMQKWANSINLLLDWSTGREVEPRQMVDILKATANMDSETLRTAGAEFMESPEAYTTIGATRDFLPQLDKDLANFETATPNRDLFWRVQNLLGEEPKKLLHDFLDGDPRPDFDRLRNRLTALDTPEAQAMVSEIEAGRVTPEGMAEQFKVFKDGDTPLTTQEFFASVLSRFEDHMKDWGKEYFDLRQANQWEESLRLLKGAQSLLLLDLSPSAIVNDFVNERVMMATVGTLGLTPAAKVDAWIKDFGLAPKEAGFGLLGDVAKQESGVVEQMTRGEGPVSTVASALNRLRGKLPRSQLASRFNEAHAKQIYYSEAKSYWSRSWMEGKGFDRMSPSLEARLREYGLEPQLVYQNMRSVFNVNQLENFQERVVGHDLNVFIDDAAQVIGKPSEEISSMLGSLGVLDDLREKLDKAQTPYQRAEAFDSLNETVRRQAAERDAQHLAGFMDHYKNKVATEKQAGALHAAQDIALDFFEGRMENDRIWDRAWSQASKAKSKTVRDQILSRAATDTSEMWKLRQIRQENLYGALFDGMDTKVEFYLEFMKHLRKEHTILRDFFTDRNTAVEKLKSTIDEPKVMNELWENHRKEFNERFAKDQAQVIEIQKQRNELFVKEQGRLFGVEGEAMARQWVDAVMRHTEGIHQRIVDFRSYVSDVKNMPKEFAGDWLSWQDAEWKQFKPEYQRMWAERMGADMEGAGNLYKWDANGAAVQGYAQSRLERIATRLDELESRGDVNTQLSELQDIQQELIDAGLEYPARAGKEASTRLAELLQQAEAHRERLLNEAPDEAFRNKINEFDETLSPTPTTRTGQGSDVPLLPPGGYDQMSGWMDIGKVLTDGYSEEVRPVLDAMRESALSAKKRYTFEGMKLDGETQGQLNEWLTDTRSKMQTAKRAAKGWAEAQRDFALLDYERQYGFDKLLSAGVPYEFFGTRTGANWMTRVLDRPAWISRFVRLQNLHDTYQSQLPERMRKKYFIPIPFLPEWAGGGTFIDPTYQLFPFKQFTQPLEAMRRDNANLMNNATYVLREWGDDGTISPEAAQQALQTQSGNIWERALAEAKLRQGENANSGADYFSMLLSPALYLTVPYYLATGKKPLTMSWPSGQMPITRFGAGVETAFKGTSLEWAGNIAGLLAKPEQLARKKLSLSEFGEWGDFYIDRQIANMVTEGKIDSKAAQLAMIERKGQTYDDAVTRVRQELMLKVPGMAPLYGAAHGATFDKVVGSLIPSLFPGGLLPPGEMEYKGLKQEYGLAWDQYKAGDKKAISNFFDAHPEYQARLALRRDPQERLTQFLRSEIWDAYGNLGPTDRKTAVAFLGDPFKEFLDASSDTEFSTDQLAIWSRMLKGLVPEVPQTQAVPQAEQLPQINYYDQNVTRITDEFFSQRTKYYGNYYELEQGYYALPKSQRASYLLKNPELKEYWQWKDKWFKSYPQLEPILRGQVFKRIDVSNWPPGLVDYVNTYAYSGKKLPKGAFKALEQQWILEGSPYENMNTWLNSTVVPALLYGNQQ